MKKSDAYQAHLDQIKNQKYRTYFAMLKSQYADTETAKDLLGSCTYFSFFMK
ncbi:hypothetical protein [Chryseobacterium sp. POE27]|uniref:hypothetical protein n=1 Tax=Chryseobacterium sp. POE27 TaxID=3138177 RepID=UPI00321A13CD